jgi:hypothetical protein
VQLDGGELVATYAGSNYISGSIHATANSRLRAATSGTVLIPASVRVPQAITLTSDGRFRFTGDMQVDGTLTTNDPITAVLPALGKVVSGAGTLHAALDIRNGGILAPGSGVGQLIASSATLGADGIYNMELASATGAPGQAGDHLAILGNLTVSATGAQPFKVRPVITSANFDPGDSSFWQIASAMDLSAPTALVTVDRSQTPGLGVFSVASVGNKLLLRYQRTVTSSDWNVDGGGEWDIDPNWIGGIPDWPTSRVNFGDAHTANSPAHISLNARRFVASLNFQNSGGYIIDPGTLSTATLSVGAANVPGSITVGLGDHEITAGLEVGSNLPINVSQNSSLSLAGVNNSGGRTITKTGPGTLSINGPQFHATGALLNVPAGVVHLNSNAGAPPTSSSDAQARLQIIITGEGSKVVLGADQDIADIYIDTTDSGNQTLDLNSPATPGAFRSVRLYASDIAAARGTLAALIKSAIDNPGDGIDDSGLATRPGSVLGFARFSDRWNRSYLLIRPTRIGDLNLDGRVTIVDFLQLASRFDQPGSWQDGDINHDGRVTIADFLALAGNFNSTYSGDFLPTTPEDQQLLTTFASSIGASVPEPAALLLLPPILLTRRIRPRFR